MSKIITQEELLAELEKSEGFIQNGSPDCVEGIKYDFRFGGRFLKALHGRVMDVEDFPKSDVKSVRVEPGETVFVLTEETLHLPNDIKAELSLKRKLAHEGILILGGFCVDPQYHGRLMFGVHNLGSAPFPLIKNKKIIAAQFYRLSPEEIGEYPVPDSIKDIPRDVVASIHEFTGVSIRSLEKRIDELNTTVRNLRDDFDKHEGWFTDFSEKLDKIRTLLENEVKQRQSGESEGIRLLKVQEEHIHELGRSRVELERQMQKHEVILSFAKWLTGGIILVIIGIILVQLIG